MEKAKKLFDYLNQIGERIDTEIHIEQVSIDENITYRVYLPSYECFESGYVYDEELNLFVHDYMTFKKEDGFVDISIDTALEYVEKYFHRKIQINVGGGLVAKVSHEFLYSLQKQKLTVTEKLIQIKLHETFSYVESKEIK